MVSPGTLKTERELENTHETSIPTVQNPAQTSARVFEPELRQERARHPGESPAPGAQATDTRLMTGVAMATTASCGFPRSMRLRRRREFDQARQAGRRLARGCLVANWLECPDAAGTRLGVIVGRKVGKAVVRSRTRRLLREVFRLHQFDFVQPVTLVLVARPSIVGKTLAEVERDFLAAMRTTRLLKAVS
jgi:ribonuclease P protein component